MPDLIHVDSPAGTVRWTVATVADPGWLLFNQSLANADKLYPALWNVAPSAWKSGSTLTLPDVANKTFEVAGTTAVGATGGANSVTIGANNLPTHTHPVDPPSTALSITDPGHVHSVDPPNTTVTVTDPGHVHSVNPPSTAVAVTDPGHTHAPLTTGNNFVTQNATGSAGVPGSNPSGLAANDATTKSNTTGITAAVDIAAFNSVTATTGITAAVNVAAFNSASATNGLSGTVDIVSFASGNNTTTATALTTTPAHLALVPQIRAY